MAGVVPSYGTTRVLLHAERRVYEDLTVGGRVGFAFGGGPTPAKGPGFNPLHLEARLAYWFGPDLVSGRGLRGFLFVSGGVAQVDASRSVEVTECRAGSPSGCVPATNTQPGGPNPDQQRLDAYQKLGQGFVSVGGGLSYALFRGNGLLLELKVVQLFPSSGTVISPSLGYVFHAL